MRSLKGPILAVMLSTLVVSLNAEASIQLDSEGRFRCNRVQSPQQLTTCHEEVRRGFWPAAGAIGQFLLYHPTVSPETIAESRRYLTPFVSNLIGLDRQFWSELNESFLVNTFLETYYYNSFLSSAPFVEYYQTANEARFQNTLSGRIHAQWSRYLFQAGATIDQSFLQDVNQFATAGMLSITQMATELYLNSELFDKPQFNEARDILRKTKNKEAFDRESIEIDLADRANPSYNEENIRQRMENYVTDSISGNRCSGKCPYIARLLAIARETGYGGRVDKDGAKLLYAKVAELFPNTPGIGTDSPLSNGPRPYFEPVRRSWIPSRGASPHEGSDTWPREQLPFGYSAFEYVKDADISNREFFKAAATDLGKWNTFPNDVLFFDVIASHIQTDVNMREQARAHLSSAARKLLKCGIFVRRSWLETKPRPAPSVELMRSPFRPVGNQPYPVLFGRPDRKGSQHSYGFFYEGAGIFLKMGELIRVHPISGRGPFNSNGFLAHEYGHLLGLDHPANLIPSIMQYGDFMALKPEFTDEQCEHMRKSDRLTRWYSKKSYQTMKEYEQTPGAEPIPKGVARVARWYLEAIGYLPVDHVMTPYSVQKLAKDNGITVKQALHALEYGRNYDWVLSEKLKIYPPPEEMNILSLALGPTVDVSRYERPVPPYKISQAEFDDVKRRYARRLEITKVPPRLRLPSGSGREVKVGFQFPEQLWDTVRSWSVYFPSRFPVSEDKWILPVVTDDDTLLLMDYGSFTVLQTLPNFSTRTEIP